MTSTPLVLALSLALAAPPIPVPLTSHPSPRPSSAFGYDNNANSNLLDDNDHLASVISPEATLTFFTNAFDRLTTAKTTGSPNQPDVTVSYTYDKNGNRTSLAAVQAPSTTVASLSYTPDSLNRLDLLTNVLTSQAVDFQYDPLSRRKQTDFPNTTRTTTTYNAASEADLITHTFLPSTLISSFDYAPDPIGNRDTLTETRPHVYLLAGKSACGTGFRGDRFR